MKKILNLGLIALMAIISSCSMSTSDVAEETRSLFNSKGSELGLVAKDVTLTKIGENSYKGLITISDGEDVQDFTILVTCDGETRKPRRVV